MNRPKVKTIKIDKFEFPTNSINPIESLVYAYDTMPIVDDNPRLIVAGREMQTTLNRVKLLKALVTASVNRNEEYGKIMAYALTSVIKSISSSAEKIVVPMAPDSNKFSTLIISSINTFIQERVDVTNTRKVTDSVRYLTKEYEEWFKEEVLSIGSKKVIIDKLFKNHEKLHVSNVHYNKENLCLDIKKPERLFISPSRKAEKSRSFELSNGWIIQSSALTYNNGIVEDSVVCYTNGNDPSEFIAYYAVYEESTDTYQYFRRVGLKSDLEECAEEDMVAGKR